MSYDEHRRVWFSAVESEYWHDNHAIAWILYLTWISCGGSNDGSEVYHLFAE